MTRRAARNAILYVGIADENAQAEPIAYISSFNFNGDTDKINVTAWGDQNKVHVSGLPDASGDFAGYWDAASAQMFPAARDGQPRRFYFYPDRLNHPGIYWYGRAFWSFSLSAEVDGAVEIKGSWTAAGPFTKVG